jgi:glucose-1-phosphate thymidylyltransferase
VVEKALSLKPSQRGELEITDLNRLYLEENSLYVEIMDRGFAWLDMGTTDSMMDSANFISAIQNRQGVKVCCPEEVAFENGWISADELRKIAEPLSKNEYGRYLLKLL